MHVQAEPHGHVGLYTGLGDPEDYIVSLSYDDAHALLVALAATLGVKIGGDA